VPRTMLKSEVADGRSRPRGWNGVDGPGCRRRPAVIVGVMCGRPRTRGSARSTPRTGPLPRPATDDHEARRPPGERPADEPSRGRCFDRARRGQAVCGDRSYPPEPGRRTPARTSVPPLNPGTGSGRAILGWCVTCRMSHSSVGGRELAALTPPGWPRSPSAPAGPGSGGVLLVEGPAVRRQDMLVDRALRQAGIAAVPRLTARPSRRRRCGRGGRVLRRAGLQIAHESDVEPLRRRRRPGSPRWARNERRRCWPPARW